MSNRKNVYIVTLGCARNQVDSEVMAGELEGAGWTLADRPESARVIVVNTCSFIESAADEAIDTILALADYKRTGACRRLVVTGCLPERYREATGNALTEVDVFLGTGAYDQIVSAVGGLIDDKTCVLPDPDAIRMTGRGKKRRVRETPSAYLKIAEGCNRHCTYCIIPGLRGRQKSRPMEDILQEARLLIAAGVKELVLVAQETTHYGADLSSRAGLAELLYALAGLAAPAPVWIRFLYGHPESMDSKLVEIISDTPVLLPYFDLPIQHASGRVLKKMGRQYDMEDLVDLFGRIRRHIPEAVLRTTVITGFPGETEDDFSQLVDFVRQVRFDHLGVFTYSDAEDLPAHRYPDPVPAAVARERLRHLMTLQMDISREKNQRYVGKNMDVLVEEISESGLWTGRTACQAPEVDGVTFIRTEKGQDLIVGDFVRARIVDAMEYDLVAEAGDPEQGIRDVKDIGWIK
ncbi:MAG: 30S ribosomal protein S12 methylthiotransferase RimO [Deltaproteobacteria bacterium]|nr:MAG: 30S ribosomal protein S12 methylthiotransferase RimO [Deltaproteobacteria bacterium]